MPLPKLLSSQSGGWHGSNALCLLITVPTREEAPTCLLNLKGDEKEMKHFKKNVGGGGGILLHCQFGILIVLAGYQSTELVKILYRVPSWVI